MSKEEKEKVKIWVGLFVAFGLVLSIAQNIHYFLKYNATLDVLNTCADYAKTHHYSLKRLQEQQPIIKDVLKDLDKARKKSEAKEAKNAAQ
ncbi:hypothetical protein [Helicobacter felis]|uniref:hypothetical protein n=1 Tax=Helicobacter felis TaxID=214 RepID=UPI000CF0544A|nr:hypothetical protein [Helicobacter felis]